MALLVLLLFAVPTILVLSFVDEPGWADEIGAALPVARIVLLLMVLAVVAYVLEKERALVRLQRALANERALRAAFEQHLRDVTSVANARRAMGAADGPERPPDLVASAVLSLFHADHATVMLVDGDELVVAGAAGQKRPFVGFRQPLESGVAGYVARTGRALLLQGDLDAIDVAASLGEPIRRTTSVPPASSMSVPLLQGEAVLGVLNVSVDDEDRAFDQRGLSVFGLFAQEAAPLFGGGSPTAARLTPVSSSGHPVDETYQSLASDSHDPRLRHAFVVVAAGDPATLLQADTVLGPRCAEIALVSDGVSLRESITARRPEAVVCDVTAPLVDGADPLSVLADLPPVPRVVCISDPAARRVILDTWGLELVDDIVGKDAPPGALIEVLDAALRRSDGEREEHRRDVLRRLLSGTADHRTSI